MIKTGFIINIIAIILITLLTWYIGRAIFDIDMTTMPHWAR
jgi:hypothetical protein